MMSSKPSEPVDVNGVKPKPKRLPRLRYLNWRTLDPAKLKAAGNMVDELTTYKEHLEELLKREGDYVVIKGRQVIGVFVDREQAVEKALDLFGGQPTLVKKIVAKEPIHYLGGAAL